MKRLLIPILFIFLSCTKDNLPQTYEYLPDQPTVIDVFVIKEESVEFLYNDMLLEVNADYFNRYGIAVNLIVDDVISLKDLGENEVFLPTPKQDGKIRVYVIPQQKINLKAYAYAITNRNLAVLGDGVQTNRTLTHEIGHLLGLSHLYVNNNVMRPVDIAWQFDRPNNFLLPQIDTILTNLKSRDLINLKSYGFIID